MNEITNNNPFGTTNPTQIAFTGAFKAEYDGWRKRRPQWLALCRAIRNELPKDQIYGLAADAGASINEVWDMQTLYRRAKDSKDEASKLDSVEKSLTAAEKRLQAATKTLDKPGLSITEQDNARAEFEAASFGFEKAKLDVIGPRQAAQCLALARSENLI